MQRCRSARPRRRRLSAGGLGYDAHPDKRSCRDRSTELFEHYSRPVFCTIRGPRSRARDCTIDRIKKIGRRRWTKEAGYHRQARVENAFFRYKSIIGSSLRSRSPGGRVAETVIACNLLNQMTDLGRPDSDAIGR